MVGAGAELLVALECPMLERTLISNDAKRQGPSKTKTFQKM
jgi:hypothetical protein